MKDTLTKEKEPQVINEYELIRPFNNKNAGFSRWSFAKRRGKEYFIKEFISPIFPTDDGAISNKLRNDRIAECMHYEQDKKKLYDAIGKVSDGNLIRTFEFFRYKSHYYITTEKVSGDVSSFEEISNRSLEDKIILCRSVAHSIMQLHKAGIVHSDIKQSNVLVKETKTGKLVGKIIDFDCSFFTNNPPADADELGGDLVYLAPESCMFLCGEEVELDTKMDVFALGLLIHQYLTGDLPEFDHEEYDYIHEAVLDEAAITLSGKLDAKLANMIAKMLHIDPEERITAQEVFDILGTYLPNYDDEYKENVLNSEIINEPVINEVKNTTSNSSNNPGGFFKQAGDL